MGLGNRTARLHQTVRTAGIDPAVYWDFTPGQTVLTVDGFLGKVIGVNDGPVAGNEEYEVLLHNGLGGGLYTSGQLKAATDHTATENTAVRDYPELAEVLTERPDPGRYPSSTLGLTASLHPKQAEEGGEGKTPGLCENGHLTWGGQCASCGNAPEGQNSMVTNPGDHRPQNVENLRNASVTAGMHGMPLFEVGDRVVNHRGEGATVRTVRDSGHPGKSNRVSVISDDQAHLDPDSSDWTQRPDPTEYYEHVFKPHPDAPPEQVARYHQRKADNKAATDLLTSVESSDPDIEWAFRQRESARQASLYSGYTPEMHGECDFNEDGECDNHEGETRRVDKPCEVCGSEHHTDDEHQDVPQEDDAFINDRNEAYLGGKHIGTGQGDNPHDHAHYLVEQQMQKDGYYPNIWEGRDGDTPGHEHHQESVKNHFNVEHPLAKFDMPCPSCGAGNQEDRSGNEEPELPTDHLHHCPGCKLTYDPCEWTDEYAEKHLTDLTDHEPEKHAEQSVNDAFSEIDPGGHGRSLLGENPKGPSRYSTLEYGWRMLTAAQGDPSLAFHLTATWHDVRNKAKRIRAEGGVHITTSQNGYYIAQVQGDHGTYESVLMRVPGTQKVGQWDCGCKWAQYHWGAPDDFSRFAGRMCSHALALNLECQSRGMFGREVKPNEGVPRWLNRHLVERISATQVQPWDDVEDVVAAEEPYTGDRLPHTSFLQVFARLAVEAGESPAKVADLLGVLGAVNSPFGEPGPNPVPGISPAGPTEQRRQENPASAGFLTSSDPDGWGQQQPQDLGDRMAALDEAVFEPEMGHESGFKEMLMAAPLLAIPGVGEAAEAAAATAGAGEAAAGAGEVAAGAGEAASGGGGLMSKVPGAGTVQKMIPGGNVVQKGNEFAQKLKAWTDKDKAEGDAVKADQARRMTGVLQDEPEPALPETYGAEDDGDEDDEDMGAFIGSSVSTGVEYAVPTDPGQSGASAAPNSNLKSDPTSLEPEDPSFVSTGTLADVLAEFQRTAGAQALEGGGVQAVQDNAEIAGAAQAFLQKEAMATFTPAQQAELINEGKDVRASNLDRLEITGTHYEALEALQGDDDEDEGWMS